MSKNKLKVMKRMDDLPIEFLTESAASNMTESNPFSDMHIGLWNRLYIAKRLLPIAFEKTLYPNFDDEFADYIDDEDDRYLSVSKAIRLAKHITGCYNFNWKQAMLTCSYHSIPPVDIFREKDDIDITVFPIIPYDVFWSILENHLYESHHIKRDYNYDYTKMPKKGNGIPDPMSLENSTNQYLDQLRNYYRGY
jgi:hypothetical protein